MSAPMVRAILDGRKTQTRRIIPVQPDSFGPPQWWVPEYCKQIRPPSEEVYKTEALKRCKYGQPGDILWVRETWQTWALGWIFKASYGDELPKGIKWKPSIFMPREASRIRLEVTDIRVERPQDISEEDCMAEGIERAGYGYKSYEIIHAGRHKGEPNPHSVIPNNSPITSYMELWESINGLNSWELNLWVWVISFKRIQQ